MFVALLECDHGVSASLFLYKVLVTPSLLIALVSCNMNVFILLCLSFHQNTRLAIAFILTITPFVCGQSRSRVSGRDLMENVLFLKPMIHKTGSPVNLAISNQFIRHLDDQRLFETIFGNVLTCEDCFFLPQGLVTQDSLTVIIFDVSKESWFPLAWIILRPWMVMQPCLGNIINADAFLSTKQQNGQQFQIDSTCLKERLRLPSYLLHTKVPKWLNWWARAISSAYRLVDISQWSSFLRNRAMFKSQKMTLQCQQRDENFWRTKILPLTFFFFFFFLHNSRLQSHFVVVNCGVFWWWD